MDKVEIQFLIVLIQIIMEISKIKIIVLWVTVICGFALHTLADLLPLFWAESITVEATGNAPAGLLTFMMTVSYLIPVIGVLCTLYGRGRLWYIGNVVLAILMFLFNLFHLGELFTGFSAVQLPLLPVILIVSGFLCMESWRFAKK